MNGNPFRRQAVLETPEFRRIFALPRFTMPDAEAEHLATELTRALKTSAGTWRLRPIQARALHAMGVYGGLFGPMRVGAGKTLTSLLAPYILEAKKPVLLLPAALIEKTRAEQSELSHHWLIPDTLRLISYQVLGRENGAKILEQYGPDLIIADEAQKLKNKRAAVTRRVSRFMQENPQTKFVAISGTMMKDSIRDFAHIIAWCLKEGTPVPRPAAEVDEWADALDDKLENEFKRLDPGPLLRFATKEDRETANDETQAARRGFRRRLTETPGVVATQNEQVDCRLRVTAVEYRPKPATDHCFEKLRAKWRTPDDWDLMMATEVWRVANELSLGFHYVQVDKEKYGKWATEITQRRRRGKTGSTEQEISKGFGLTTGREALFETLRRKPSTSERPDTGSLSRSTKNSSLSSTDIATSAEDLLENTGFASTTTTEQAGCVASFASPAIVPLDVSGIPPKDYAELLSTFLSQARPPDPWRNARRDWFKYVREVLSRSRTLDSELQVRNAVRHGDRPDGVQFLEPWSRLEPTCKLYTFAVWHDDTALDVCVAWMKRARGIVWTNHSFFAHELAKRAEVSYFGQNGLDRRGRRIDDVAAVNATTDPGGIVASQPSNSEGRNLQYAWSRNLITMCPSSSLLWEQLLGRTHRDGQKEGLVTVDVLMGCKEHYAAWQASLSKAQAALDTTGMSQKLLICDVVGFPDEDDVAARKEWRWGAQADPEVVSHLF